MILLSGRLATHAVRVLVVWVGCGPYSGRFAFTVSLTPRAFPRTLSVWCVGVLLFVLAY